MKNPSLNIDKMLTIDDTGMPKAPNIRQLQDKDLLTLYQRDISKDKHKFIKECGVIYYLGDPKSPAKQQGLNDKECLKLAIENYDLPKDYEPDNLVKRLIDKYYVSNITEAGMALDALRKSIHLVSVGANKINDLLYKKLQGVIEVDDAQQILNLIKSVQEYVKLIPDLTKAISTAYDNLRNEEEEQLARGGRQILSSMNADEDII